ncbi:MAG: hypothetical protein OEO23_09295 [Gemmatimonadota bacterium]|nr:hypothetical protein [Gemmatimonadota bacterium]
MTGTADGDIAQRVRYRHDRLCKWMSGLSFGSLMICSWVSSSVSRV